MFMSLCINLRKFANKIKYHITQQVMLCPWIPEPSTVNNKLKRREGSGSTGRFFDLNRANHKTELVVLVQNEGSGSTGRFFD
jgi:hypothetical protein